MSFILVNRKTGEPKRDENTGAIWRFDKYWAAKHWASENWKIKKEKLKVGAGKKYIHSEDFLNE